MDLCRVQSNEIYMNQSFREIRWVHISMKISSQYYIKATAPFPAQITLFRVFPVCFVSKYVESKSY